MAGLLFDAADTVVNEADKNSRLGGERQTKYYVQVEAVVCQTEINAEQGRESGSIEVGVAAFQIINSEGLVEKVASEWRLKG